MAENSKSFSPQEKMIALDRWWILKEPDREGTQSSALKCGPVLALIVTAWYCSIKTKKSMVDIRQLYKGEVILKIALAESHDEDVLRSLYRPSDEIEIAAYLL